MSDEMLEQQFGEMDLDSDGVVKFVEFLDVYLKTDDPLEIGGCGDSSIPIDKKSPSKEAAERAEETWPEDLAANEIAEERRRSRRPSRLGCLGEVEGAVALVVIL